MDRDLMRIIVSKWLSKPVYAAAELDLAGCLSDGPLTVESLADRCGADASVLYRMMRALACAGIFSELEDGRFGLTPMAELLRPDALGPAARMFNSKWNDEAWISFLDGVRTGRVPFETAHGTDFSSWLEGHPEEARTLMEANAVRTATSVPAVLEAYDFSGAETVVDVGGGSGSLMMGILEKNPGVRGVIADIPAVAAEARDIVKVRGMEGRCEVIECDFYDRVPEGGDIYILSNILHDWDDDRCLTILGNIRKAMGDGSRLLVIEMIVPPGNGWSIAKLLDLEMFVLSGGKERTGREYEDLLRRAGLEILRIIPTRGDMSLVEAVAV